MNLSGRVAIVTGSSRGIGKAIALALAEEGSDVVVAARTEVARHHLPGTIGETVSQILELGRRCLAVKTDVTKEEQVEHMVNMVISKFGEIDILVNNAGITALGSLVDLPIKRWDLIMNVNLRGTFLCTKAILPYMMKQKQGNIINLSSVIVPWFDSEGSLAYATAKAAIERFTLGLAREVRKYNIAVNALRPSYTLTEGLKAMMPDMDESQLQSPKMWGKYATLVAAQEVNSLSGMLLEEETLRKRFGSVQ